MTTWLLEVDLPEFRDALAHVAPTAAPGNPAPWDRIRLHVLFEGASADLHLLSGSGNTLDHGAIAHVTGRTVRVSDDWVFFGTDLVRSVRGSLPATGRVRIGVEPGAVLVRHTTSGAVVRTHAGPVRTGVGCFPQGDGWQTLVPGARWSRGGTVGVAEVFEEDYSDEAADDVPVVAPAPAAAEVPPPAVAPLGRPPAAAKAKDLPLPSLGASRTTTPDPAPVRVHAASERAGRRGTRGGR